MDITPLKHKDKSVLVLILVLVFVPFLLFKKSVTTSAWQKHTFIVLNLSEKFLSGMKDAETGQRGYLITGDDANLESFHKAQNDVADQLTQLRSLTQDNPVQQHRIDALRPLVAAKLSELSQTIELKRNHHDAEALKIVNSNFGKRTMDSIRQQIQDFNGTENDLWVLRETEFTTALNELLVFFVILSTSLVILFFESLKNQRRLRESELNLKQYAAIIESSDDAIISKSLSGIIESWNKGAERIFGFTAREAIGQSIQILIPPDLQKEESELLARVSRGEHVDQYETVRYHKNGRLINVSTTISPILNDQGRVIGVSKIARDITERKRQASLLSFRLDLVAMAAHADHLHLMRATLDKAEELTGSTIGFFHYVEEDQETISLQTWSTNTLENMCKAEGAGQHYPVNEAGVWADAIRTKMTVIQNDYPHLENKKGMPEGHAPVQRFVSTPIIRNNKIVAMIGVGNKPSDYVVADTDLVFQLADFVFDLIQTNKFQQMLSESEARYKRITEELTDYQYTVRVEDGHAVETRQSPACMIVTGYAPEEFTADPNLWIQMVVPEERERVIEHVQQILAGIEPRPIEHQIIRKDGEIRWVSDTIISNKDISGKLLSYDGVITDITERKLAESKIKYLAYHDKLTGLPNRELFFDRMSQAISQAKRKHGRLALMFLDLDGFKAVNDVYGHESGDIVLKTVATRLLACVRGVDTVARLGGDEFTIILSELEQAADAASVAGKVIQKLAEPILLHDSHQCYIGVSIGIALYPEDGCELDKLMIAADSAMYECKTGGKNNYTFFKAATIKKVDSHPWIVLDAAHLLGVPEIDQQHVELINIINRLNDALKNNASVEESAYLFDEIVSYTRFHFDTEERLMDQWHIEDEEHKQMHRHLLEEVSYLRGKFLQEGELLVLQTIKDWLLPHILEMDKPLANSLIQRGYKSGSL